MQSAEHRSDICSAAAFSPTDETVVSSGFYDDVRYSITIDQRAHFAVRVGHTDRDEFQFLDFHV